MMKDLNGIYNTHMLNYCHWQMGSETTCAIVIQFETYQLFENAAIFIRIINDRWYVIRFQGDLLYTHN